MKRATNTDPLRLVVRVTTDGPGRLPGYGRRNWFAELECQHSKLLVAHDSLSSLPKRVRCDICGGLQRKGLK